MVLTSDIGITLGGSLVNLHHVDHRIRVVCENTNDRVRLVVKQDATSRFELILVYETHDRDVILWSRSRRNECVIVVDDLFEGSDRHGRTSEVVDSSSFLDVLVFRQGGFESFLVQDKLFFEEQVVLDSVHLE